MCAVIATVSKPNAAAELFNHPDYQTLVRHKGEPNLSLLRGPSADITPSKLLSKLMSTWSENTDNQQPLKSASSIDQDLPALLVTPVKALLGNARSPLTEIAEAHSKGAAVRSGCSKSLVPSEEAVRMANIGCNAVPGMRPAAYREALYSTWMTGRPWGMQFMPTSDEVCFHPSCAFLNILLLLGTTCKREWHKHQQSHLRMTQVLLQPEIVI